MTHSNAGPSEPAAPAKLWRSTLVALAVAGVLLITVVLPAEYGIDPTGVGRVIGLTKMGEIKTRLAKEAAADAAADAAEAARQDAEIPSVPTDSTASPH